MLLSLGLIAWGFIIGLVVGMHVGKKHRRRHGIVGIRIITENAMDTVNEGTPLNFKVIGVKANGGEGPVPQPLTVTITDPTLGSVVYQPDGTGGGIAYVKDGACKLTADAGGFHDEDDLTFVGSPVTGIKIVVG